MGNDCVAMIPFRVLSVRRSIGGKGGSAKCWLEIESPFASDVTFRKTICNRATARAWKVKTVRHRYLVVHLDDDELVCLDENYEEIYWRVNDRKAMRQPLVSKVQWKIRESEAQGKDLYAIILESYCRDPYCILRTVIEVQMQSDGEDLNVSGNKSQRERP